VCSLIIVIIIIIASQPWIRRNNHHTRSLWTVCSPSAGRAYSTGRRYYYPPPTTPTTPTTTPPPATTNYTNNIRDPSIFLLRGLIGSYLPTQGSIGGGGGAITPAANDDSGYVVTGRFRVFANETLVRRFIAEMNVAAIDGSSFHNVTITEGDPHRFQVTEGSNGTTTTSVPVVSSNILGTIYLDGGATPIIDNVPMTLTVRGQSLAVQGIDIDETRIADTGGGQRDAISVIDGQSIYGIVPR
jgi:hypothetical protein